MFHDYQPSALVSTRDLIEEWHICNVVLNRFSYILGSERQTVPTAASFLRLQQFEWASSEAREVAEHATKQLPGPQTFSDPTSCPDFPTQVASFRGMQCSHSRRRAVFAASALRLSQTIGSASANGSLDPQADFTIKVRLPGSGHPFAWSCDLPVAPSSGT